MADPYPLPCPNCGHRFSLADLKTMAVGDGWRRFIFVEGPEGKPLPIDFEDYNPATMKAVETQYVDAFSHAVAAHKRFMESMPATVKDHERREG